jgi:hypothetical protein
MVELISQPEMRRAVIPDLVTPLAEESYREEIVQVV